LAQAVGGHILGFNHAESHEQQDRRSAIEHGMEKRKAAHVGIAPLNLPIFRKQEQQGYCDGNHHGQAHN